MQNGEMIPVTPGARKGAASAAAMRRKKKQDKNSTVNRVVPYVLGLLGVFLALCLLLPEQIPVSGFLCGMLTGGFSLAGWLVPVLLLIAAFSFRRDRGEEHLTERVVFSLLTLTFAAALLHLLAPEELSTFAIRPLYEAGCDLYDGIYKGDASLLYDNNY